MLCMGVRGHLPSIDVRSAAVLHRGCRRTARRASPGSAAGRVAAPGPARSGRTSATRASGSSVGELGDVRSSAPMRLESAWIASAIGSGRWIQSASGPSTRRPSTRTGWPGLPTTVEFGRHVGDDDAVGADLRAMADRDRPEQLGAGADRDVVLHGRMALAGRKAGAAERHALIERHVVADRRRSRRSRRPCRGR